MAAPTYYPLWATLDTTLPATNSSNKQRPKTTLQTIGWDKGQIPSAEEMNWMLNNIYLWTYYFNTEIVPLATAALPNNGTVINLIGEVTGTATFAGTDSLSLSTVVANASTSATAGTIVKRDSSGGVLVTTIGATGNITTTGTLIAVNITASGSLTVSSSATITGVLNVSSAIRANQYVDLGYQNTIAGTRNVGFYSAGSSTVETGYINVSGTTTSNSAMAIFAAEVTVEGNLTTNKSMTHVGNVTCESALTVAGTSYLNGTVAISGGINSTGTNTFSGSNTFNGSVTSTGTNTFSGSNTFTGSNNNFTNNLNLRSSNLSSTGYTYLPNGTILQWGSVTVAAGTSAQHSVSTNFAFQFPNECFSISCTPQNNIYNTTSGYIPVCAATSMSSTGFTLVVDSNQGVALSNSIIVMYQAVGH